MKLTLQQEKEIINLYLNGSSQRELAKMFDTDKGVIKRKLLKNNIKLRTLSEANMIYNVNDHIFDNIDSHEKAYWIGFLAADGSINRNTVKLCLAIKDINHLYRFKFFLNSTNPIKIYNATLKNKKYPCCEIGFRSENILNQLSIHSVVSNKSKTLLFSTNIPKQYISSYILGIFDGDGCFNLMKFNGTNLNIRQMRFSLLASKDVAKNIQNYFYNECNVGINKIQLYKNIHILQYGGNSVLLKISNYLYKDAEMFLTRQKKIILDHFGDKILNINV